MDMAEHPGASLDDMQSLLAQQHSEVVQEDFAAALRSGSNQAAENCWVATLKDLLHLGYQQGIPQRSDFPDVRVACIHHIYKETLPPRLELPHYHDHVASSP